MTEAYSSTIPAQARENGRDLLIRLTAGSIVRKALHFHTIDSTNTQARELARNGEPGGLLILADEQTSGRGRLGRGFISPADGGLWFTLLLRPPEGQPVSPAVTLIAGTAVCQAMRDMDILDASIKWPNDILIRERKAAGILAESGFDLHQQPYLILGIGINLTIEAFPPELAASATSVRMSTGLKIDPIQLLQGILTHFSDLSDQLNKEGFPAIRSRYLSCSSTVGRDVILTDPVMNPDLAISNRAASDPRRIYRCIDIAEDGSLVLLDPSGRVFQQNSGEISLRYPAAPTGTMERDHT